VKAAWLVPIPPAAANPALAAHVPVASLVGGSLVSRLAVRMGLLPPRVPDLALNPLKLAPAPATARPRHPGPISRAAKTLRAHPTTVPPRRSPIPALPLALKERLAPAGNPSRVLAARAGPHQAHGAGPNPAAFRNPVTKASPAAALASNAPALVLAASPAERIAAEFRSKAIGISS
jgi:hypothetical protein